VGADADGGEWQVEYAVHVCLTDALSLKCLTLLKNEKPQIQLSQVTKQQSYLIFS